MSEQDGTTRSPGQNMDCNAHVATMSRWYVVSRTMHAVAKLGIADHLSSGPKSAIQLAKVTGTKPELLERVLRFLRAYGLFCYDNELYSLTELSQPLQDEAPNSLRDVLCMVDDSWWQAFSQLDASLQSGKTAFELQHGDSFFAFLSKHPEKQQNFDRGMAKLSSYDDATISKAFDFSIFSSLVDMGGGRGGLVKAIASQCPNMQAILFDTPAVIGQIEPNDFPAGILLQEGDFFGNIPKAEAYIFKGVLHDFDDERMRLILKNCLSQMKQDAKILIAEQLIPEGCEPHPNTTMDIVMMVLLGGKQRTLREWREAVEDSGFIFLKQYHTESLFTLMEFRPK